MRKDWIIALSVCAIFINLALFGFSWTCGTIEAQVLAMSNVILLSLIFIPKE